MTEDSELNDDELDELLVKHFKQQPGKCKMKPALKFVSKDTALADYKL